MMNSAKFLHTGLQNYVSMDEIEAFNSNVYSAPTKRIVRSAEQNDRLIDHTEGRKTRSVIFMKSGSVVLSSVETMTLVRRANALLAGQIDQDQADAPTEAASAAEEAEEEVEIPAPVAKKAAAPAAKAAPAPAAKAVAAPAKAAPAPAAKGKVAAAPAPVAKGKKAAAIVEDDDDLTDLPE